MTLPKPQTSGSKGESRFVEPDFAYMADQDVYRCPAGHCEMGNRSILNRRSLDWLDEQFAPGA